MGSMKEPTVDLYEADFHAWAVDQAEKLRRGDLRSLDLAHLTEEIESLGRSERRELQSRLAQLLMHLLKWEHQALIRSRSWKDTIREQRRRLDFLLADMPSLRPKVEGALPGAYSDARLMAERETGLPISTFPLDCPYRAAEVLDDTWLPPVDEPPP